MVVLRLLLLGREQKMLQPPLLLFPTHYLGNLVLGLPWVLRALAREPRAVVVFDAAFGPLLAMLPELRGRALHYPREELARDRGFHARLRAYFGFLGELRQYRGHCLIDLEGERYSGVLARLSGCRWRIGPLAKRSRWFYSESLELDYEVHRFNAFGEILGDYAAGEAPAGELDFQVSRELAAKVELLLAGDSASRPVAVIHAGASVSYKRWPREHFASLARALHGAGCRTAWIGAGKPDAEIIAAIATRIGEASTINLCDRLSLPELAALFRRASVFIGCDSGPMHLAAACGAPVFALFGPSRESIWAPRGAGGTVLRGTEPCAPECDAWHCPNDYHCLASLTPEMVLDRVAGKLVPALEIK